MVARMKITTRFEHEELHLRAINTAKEYRRFEAALISIFQEIEKHRTFERYEMPSLFMYSTKILGLSEATTCMLTSVMRAANKVPELKAAVEEGKITLSNARRIAPVLNSSNKSEWLPKAAELPLRKLELELAKSFPEKPAPTRITPKSKILCRLEVDLPHETLDKLKRAQDILSQKKQADFDTTQTLNALLDEFLERHDPVEKAKRAETRSANSLQSRAKKSAVARQVISLRPPGSAGQVQATTAQVAATASLALPQKMSPENLELARRMGFKIPRSPIPARQKHALALNQNTQCTFVYRNGVRCESARWLHTHHITPIANGGTNAIDNLRTLCSAHHKIMHKREY